MVDAEWVEEWDGEVDGQLDVFLCMGCCLGVCCLYVSEVVYFLIGRAKHVPTDPASFFCSSLLFFYSLFFLLYFLSTSAGIPIILVLSSIINQVTTLPSS